MYFKVSVQDHIGPGTIKFRYPKKKQRVASATQRKQPKSMSKDVDPKFDLRVHYSSARNCREPSEQDNQWVKHRPTCEMLKSPDGRDHFPDTHLYLSFWSESGCSVNIFVKFAD